MEKIICEKCGVEDFDYHGNVCDDCVWYNRIIVTAEVDFGDEQGIRTHTKDFFATTFRQANADFVGHCEYRGIAIVSGPDSSAHDW